MNNKTSSLRLFACAALALLVSACAGDRPPPSSQEPSFYKSLVPAGAEVNSAMAASMITGYRKNNGLGPGAVDPVLTRVAKDHARAMAAANRVSHDLGAGGVDVRTRRAGYDYAVVVENVAAGYHTLAEAFSGWRDSPAHRRNMLNANVDKIGIAVAQLSGSKYKVFWVLVLAKHDAPPQVVTTAPGAGLLPVPLAGGARR